MNEVLEIVEKAKTAFASQLPELATRGGLSREMYVCYLSFLILPALYLTSGCKEQSKEDKRLRGATVQETVHLESVIPPSSSSIVRGRNIVGSFEWVEAKAFVPILRDEDHNLYLPPVPILERSVLGKAFEAKTIYLDGGPQPLFRMELSIPVHTKELREAASSYLAAARPGEQSLKGNVTSASLSLLPCSILEIDATIDDRTLPMYRYVNPNPANALTELPLVIIGTEEELSAWIARGRAEIRFQFAAFSTRKSLLRGTLSVFAGSKFAQDLTGDAIWKDFSEYKASKSAGQFDLGPIQFGGSSSGNSLKIQRDRLVTRNQILSVTRKCVSSLNFEDWKQDGHKIDDTLRAELTTSFSTLLMERFKPVLALIDEQGQIIVSDILQDSLKPDHITKLNAAIKDQIDLKSKRAGSYAGASASEEASLLSLDDLVWNEEGDSVIPKSVKLFQVNQAELTDFASMRYADYDATSAQGAMESPVLFTDVIPPRIRKGMTREISFEIPSMSLISGGDPDIHSKDYSPTGMKMWHSEPVVTPSEIRLTVFSEVWEGRRNWTRLGGSEIITIPLPKGFVGIDSSSILTYTQPKPLQRIVRGEQHSDVALASDERSIFRTALIRPDGRGDDHGGNARAKGTIEIPILFGSSDEPGILGYSTDLQILKTPDK
jgi:hypothetical protein